MCIAISWRQALHFLAFKEMDDESSLYGKKCTHYSQAPFLIAVNSRISMKNPAKPLHKTEFVALLTMMISILALSIDAMLPALGDIARDLELQNPNDAQLVLTSMFLGFAIGQLAAGPLSDCYGRKPVIYAGYIIFVLGCLMSIFTTSFTVMLLGRFLQGFGASAPRIVGIAIVRDGYAGREMASIMSIVMALFILVPTIGPALGQGIMMVSDWRGIFVFILIIAVIAAIWFVLRQPETLNENDKREFSVSGIWTGTVETFSHRSVVAYVVAAGLVFGGFVAYLSSAQQLFQETYDKGALFAIYFALSSLAIGAGSIINSYLVGTYGMRFLCRISLIIAALISVGFMIFAYRHSGVPPFWMFMAWLTAIMFFNGLLFGNLNALAVEPLGHIAGLAAAVFGSVSTLIAIPISAIVGASYTGGVEPLVIGQIVVCVLSYIIMRSFSDNPS